MTVRDDIWMALHDAIGWQGGLADAYPKGAPERAEALAQIKRYKAILKRRYGTDATALDEMISKSTLVNALDVGKVTSGDR